MNKTIRMTVLVFRVTGLLQLIVGVLYWTGLALNVIPFHMINGLVFVLALWTLAGLGIRAGAPTGLIALAVTWGVVLPAFGMAQMQILPSDWHWVIRVLHLFTGLVAMGIGDRLAKILGSLPRATRARAPVTVSWPEGGGL